MPLLAAAKAEKGEAAAALRFRSRGAGSIAEHLGDVGERLDEASHAGEEARFVRGGDGLEELLIGAAEADGDALDARRMAAFRAADRLRLAGPDAVGQGDDE